MAWWCQSPRQTACNFCLDPAVPHGADRRQQRQTRHPRRLPCCDCRPQSSACIADRYPLTRPAVLNCAKSGLRCRWHPISALQEWKDRSEHLFKKLCVAAFPHTADGGVEHILPRCRHQGRRLPGTMIGDQLLMDELLANNAPQGWSPRSGDQPSLGRGSVP